MLIQKPCVVALTWRLSDAQNQPMDELADPVEFFFGGDDLLPKVEEAVAGQAVGFEAHLHLEPEHAFGEYDPALVKVEPRARLPEPLEVGMQFEGMPDGSDDDAEAMIFTVTDIAEDKVVLDGNHPLAGMALRFSLKITEVRAASDEEIAHGHVHGAHGHHHGDEDDEGDAGDHFRSHPIH
ncbi:MAG TPA: peptidylprolyl isomerase [Burkholderiaceae bacterium]